MVAKWGEIRVREIVGAVGGRLVSGSDNRLIGGLSTDTRQMNPGDVFWALKGERYDGHDFVKGAVSKGAACVVVDRDIEEKIVGEEVAAIRVTDTLRALGEFARWWRHQHRTCVAAITGSVGKTSTKEMAYQILSLSEEPLKNKGNFNNLVGLPLTIFNMRTGQRRAVLEMGMNRPGEIARMTEIADPEIGVITRIGKAHLEGVGDIAGVVKAKTELIEKISKESQVILNGDDAVLMEAAAHFPRGFLTFGLGADNDLRAADVKPRGTEGITFHLRFKGAESKIRLPVPGVHSVYNALGAAAIAFCMGEPIENVVAGLEMYKGVPGRFMIT
ncbi:MAG: UDP-N-acetylmuramoyl-tripeptide--D-alanyl-D-alanine ligase, partial [Deltaproteobacteria bacterium]|nr:UDP-N-acetylmuramoyl-tripeptide--D-alanyl-D-alanine ligase [Deltaproteobacteria bacterium]